MVEGENEKKNGREGKIGKLCPLKARSAPRREEGDKGREVRRERPTPYRPFIQISCIDQTVLMHCVYCR